MQSPIATGFRLGHSRSTAGLGGSSQYQSDIINGIDIVFQVTWVGRLSNLNRNWVSRVGDHTWRWIVCARSPRHHVPQLTAVGTARLPMYVSFSRTYPASASSAYSMDTTPRPTKNLACGETSVGKWKLPTTGGSAQRDCCTSTASSLPGRGCQRATEDPRPRTEVRCAILGSCG